MKFFLIVIIFAFMTINFVSADPCHQPPDAGRCRATVMQYYFDTASKSCEQFVYGGCGGNENRFQTQEQCQQTCAKHMG
ncbi:hypothetical protein PVAND_017313 [Polypedilum vanderplanki]|uniref:Single Kunitz protease inhibitor n=1 Tax=Polypedilum vanderplanki TaxID=319348 RepID=A0A9J6BI89_POLVA|nr:hypothetical protein PVAND_017313 [Polypedilum vanderplanki]